MRRILAALCAAAILAGCSGTRVVRDAPRPVCLAGETPVDVTPIAEALLEFRGTRIQHLTGTWGDRTFVADVVIRGEEGRFTAVFLAPQVRLATVVITPPHAIEWTRVPQIPQEMEPEYALADIAFANLPTDALAKAAGGFLAIADDGVKRRVTLPDGTCVAEIVRSADGTAVCRNPARGYEYTLRGE